MVVRQVNTARLATSAALGAVLLEVLLIVAEGGRQAFTRDQLVAHAIALLGGAAGGFLFETTRSMLHAVGDSITEVDRLRRAVDQLTGRITYQDSALQLLLTSPRHNAALSALITASVADNFKNVPFVSPVEYLRFLQLAVAHSDRYEAIHRHPLRWYRETPDVVAYLDVLREAPIRRKARLFVLDEQAVAEMREDVRDPELVALYWRHAADTDSYWMSEADFRKNFPNIAVPQDCVFYDRSLLIQYDEERQVLGFDVLTRDSEPSRIFTGLDRLIGNGASVVAVVPRPVRPTP